MPKVIRDELGLKPGDDVEFERHGSEIVLVPRIRRSILDFAGVLPPAPGIVVPKTTAGWKRWIRDASAEAAVERYERIQRQARPGSRDAKS